MLIAVAVAVASISGGLWGRRARALVCRAIPPSSLAALGGGLSCAAAVVSRRAGPGRRGGGAPPGAGCCPPAAEALAPLLLILTPNRRHGGPSSPRGPRLPVHPKLHRKEEEVFHMEESQEGAEGGGGQGGRVEAPDGEQGGESSVVLRGVSSEGGGAGVRVSVCMVASTGRRSAAPWVRLRRGSTSRRSGDGICAPQRALHGRPCLRR